MTTLPQMTDSTPLDDEQMPVSESGLYCEVCRTPLEYAGKGRKPRYCAVHKKGGGTAKASSGGKMPASDSLAEQAASMLGMANRLFGMGLMAFGLPMSAAAIGGANEHFEVMAKQALLTDPKLCRKILSAGSTSGAAGLAIAYAGLGAAVAPTLVGEFKERKAAKELEYGNDDASA